MFFDDELDKIFEDGQEKGEHIETTAKKLLDACWKNAMGDGTIPQSAVGIKAWQDKVRRTEWSWRLFAKKHKGLFKEDGFKSAVLKSAEETKGKDYAEKFRKFFKW